MIRRLIDEAKGATIVEFAVVAPLFCLMVLMILQGGIAFQRWNAVQATARTAARCLAIASPRCTTSAPGAGDPGTTYTLAAAAANGVSGITADMIATDITTDGNGLVYQQVTIRFPVTILGQSLTLQARDRFPQP